MNSVVVLALLVLCFASGYCWAKGGRSFQDAEQKQRLWQHVFRLWDERDAALARVASLEHELARLQAVVGEEDYAAIDQILNTTPLGHNIDEIVTEVHERAARLNAADEARVNSILNKGGNK
jgi:hypothetical protein